jgi:Transposase IS116/IS110/IS902 family
MAQQSARRGRKNQMNSSCLEHAFMIWFRSANSHTGPQLHRCIRGRTDGSIRLRANLLQKPLALGGASTDAKGRDFAAWLGLTPLQRSTGGKQKLGATSKMGERTLRRLLIIGSSAVVQQASKRGAPKGSWLEQMLARKPRMLVTVALANKMARIIWALLVKKENYRAPVAAKA